MSDHNQGERLKTCGSRRCQKLNEGSAGICRNASRLCGAASLDGVTTKPGQRCVVNRKPDSNLLLIGDLRYFPDGSDGV